MISNLDNSYKIRASQDIKDIENQAFLRKLDNIIKKAVSEQDIKIITEKINELFEKQSIMRGRNVRMSYNKDINRIIITVIDKQNGEILREIPPKQIQDLASYFRQILKTY